MRDDLVRRRDVQKMLQDADGWDAPEEFFKGWDKALHVAEQRLADLPSAGEDLIKRSDVIDALAVVFREYNFAFEPDSKSKYRRRFSIAVPEAIFKIPAATGKQCEKEDDAT